MSIKFYYVRHGRTEFNEEKRLQGYLDSPLTKEGREDAIKAREALKTIPFTKAFSSSSDRAKVTGEIILEDHPEVPLIPLDGLKEFDFGVMDGECMDDPRWRKEMDKRKISESWKDLGGDDRKSMQFRIKSTLKSILGMCDDGDVVLLVGHAAYAMHMLEPLFGIDDKQYRKQVKEEGKATFPNGGIMVFEYDGVDYKMVSLPIPASKFEA